MKSSIAGLSLLALCLTACGTAATNESGDPANATVANGAGEIGGNDQTATGQAAAFPPEAREAWIAAQRRNCRESGARFDESGIRFEAFNGRNDNEAAGGANIFRAADFNGDSRPDFIMITNNGGCPATENDLGSMGARGIPHDFLISGPQGYQLASGTLIGDDLMARVTRRGDRDVLDLRFTEENAIPRDVGRCGLVAQVVFGWTNGAMDVIERRNAEGQLVDRENCVQAAAASGGAAPIAPLNIMPGHYVAEDAACGRPVGGVFYYDGRRAGMMYPPDTGPAELMPIGRPVRRGGFWEFDDGSAVQVLAPDRIRWRYEEVGPPMRLCRSDQVPASVRVRG